MEKVIRAAVRPKTPEELRQILRANVTERGHVPEPAPEFTSYRENRIAEILTELRRRKYEALNLYVPQPYQEEFHSCKAHERVFRSGVRAGKTVAGAIELARCVTCQDPHGKFPTTGHRIAVIVGYGQEHIGNTMYRMLFKPGAFRIIRDPATRKWRSFNPENEWDVAHKAESKPAPPLIPKRFIQGKPAWVSKGEDVFSVIRLTTGWEVRAYSSRGKPPQGFKADAYWFDEDIDNPEWIDESQARISDTDSGGGRLWWTARPQTRSDALRRMSQRAAEQRITRPDDPDIVEVKFDRRLNQHLDKVARERLSRALKFHSEEAAKMLDFGDFPFDEWMVFPELCKQMHEVPLYSPEFVDGQLPADWTRFAVIDPGVAVCAVLFAAVPPPRFGDFVYLEDELYILNATDEKLGRAMKEKTEGRVYHAWIIDTKGSDPRNMSGKSTRKQIEDAFEKYRIRSTRTGFGFLGTHTHRASRVQMVHRWLAPRETAPPKLRVVEGRLPNFWREAENYHRKRIRDPNDNSKWIVTDEPDDRGSVHTQVLLQYLAACQAVRYEEPTKQQEAMAGVRKGWATRYLKEKQSRHGGGASYVNLGPGNPYERN